MANIGHGYMPSIVAGARLGDSKKVTVTASPSVILSEASNQVGVIVRVLEFTNCVRVTIGNDNLTIDSGSSPGAYALDNENAVIELNITGNVVAVCDGTSADLSVTPLRIDGYARGKN